MKTLLLIAPQIDLLPFGGAEIPDSQSLADSLPNLMTGYDLVVTAKFWLPVAHKMFAANHPWRRPGQVLELDGEAVELHNFFCIQDSFGAELFSGVDASKIAFTALMGIRPEHLPHSAFFDAGKNNPTGLADFLTEKKVTEIHLAGMPLEKDVKNTALDAVELGFKVVALAKFCCSKNMEFTESTFLKMSKKGVEIKAE